MYVRTPLCLIGALLPLMAQAVLVAEDLDELQEMESAKLGMGETLKTDNASSAISQVGSRAQVLKESTQLEGCRGYFTEDCDIPLPSDDEIQQMHRDHIMDARAQGIMDAPARAVHYMGLITLKARNPTRFVTNCNLLFAVNLLSPSGFSQCANGFNLKVGQGCAYLGADACDPFSTDTAPLEFLRAGITRRIEKNTEEEDEYCAICPEGTDLAGQTPRDLAAMRASVTEEQECLMACTKEERFLSTGDAWTNAKKGLLNLWAKNPGPRVMVSAGGMYKFRLKTERLSRLGTDAVLDNIIDYKVFAIQCFCCLGMSVIRTERCMDHEKIEIKELKSPDTDRFLESAEDDWEKKVRLLSDLYMGGPAEWYGPNGMAKPLYKDLLPPYTCKSRPLKGRGEVYIKRCWLHVGPDGN